jgi:hypothetical protein
LFALQLLFWKILKFSSTFLLFKPVEQSYFENFLRVRVLWPRRRAVGVLGVPTQPTYFRPFADARGPRLTCLRTPLPSQVAPTPQGGPGGCARLLRRTGTHALVAPHAQHLAVSRAQVRRPSLNRRHAPQHPSRIRPLGPETAHHSSITRRHTVCAPRRRTRPPPILLELPTLTHVHKCLVNVPASRCGRPSLLLVVIALGGDDRHPRRRQPSPEAFTAKPTKQIDLG